jgi:hypothetical protein
MAGSGEHGYTTNVCSLTKRTRRKFLAVDPGFKEIENKQGAEPEWSQFRTGGHLARSDTQSPAGELAKMGPGSWQILTVRRSASRPRRTASNPQEKACDRAMLANVSQQARALRLRFYAGFLIRPANGLAAFEGWFDCERSVQSRPRLTQAPDGIHALEAFAIRRLRQQVSSSDELLQPSFSRSPSSYSVYRQRGTIQDGPLCTFDSLFWSSCLSARPPKVPALFQAHLAAEHLRPSICRLSVP